MHRREKLQEWLKELTKDEKKNFFGALTEHGEVTFKEGLQLVYDTVTHSADALYEIGKAVWRAAPISTTVKVYRDNKKVQKAVKTLVTGQHEDKPKLFEAK